MTLPKLQNGAVGEPRYASKLITMTLEELFDEAAKYGMVVIFSSEKLEHPNRYKCSIEFATKEHTKMEADSSRGLTVKRSLIEAIENARQMVDLARAIGATND